MSATATKAAAPEVIQDWADGEGGYTFERGRMEAAVRNICFENPVTLHAPTASSKPTVKLNRDDVDFVTKKLMVPRAHAEEALAAHDGDLTKALTQLMASPLAKIS